MVQRGLVWKEEVHSAEVRPRRAGMLTMVTVEFLERHAAARPAAMNRDGTPRAWLWPAIR
jgi:hypothetical protein